MIVVRKMQMLENRFRVEKRGHVVPREQLASNDKRKKSSGFRYAIVRGRRPKSGGGEQFQMVLAFELLFPEICRIPIAYIIAPEHFLLRVRAVFINNDALIVKINEHVLGKQIVIADDRLEFAGQSIDQRVIVAARVFAEEAYIILKVDRSEYIVQELELIFKTAYGVAQAGHIVGDDLIANAVRKKAKRQGVEYERDDDDRTEAEQQLDEEGVFVQHETEDHGI